MAKKTRASLFIALVLTTLACQAVYRTFEPPATATPFLKIATRSFPAPASATPSLAPTFTPQPPTETPIPTQTPAVTPTFRVTPSALQLRIFEDLWGTVHANYLYTDFNGVDWEAVREEYRKKVEAGLTMEDFYFLMGEMIYALGDEHSVYLSPDDVAQEQAEFAGDSDYVGIGVLTTPADSQDRVTVIVVFPGSPAEEAGIQPHDNLLEVNGLPILEGDLDRRTLLRGEEGTLVEVLVQTPGSEPRTIRLPRRRVEAAMPVPYALLESERGKRIGYILLATFADETVGGQVRSSLEALTAQGRLDGLIIDNRQNGGGIDNVTSKTLGYFISGVAGYFVNREGQRAFNIFGEDVNGSLDVPLVVLVGHGTASFGEIFSGILQDLGRAKIVGELTDGNVEILWSFDFEDGSRVWLAHDTFRPRNDPERNWEQTGIIPDIELSSKWEEVTLETDPVVKAAQELLEGGENR